MTLSDVRPKLENEEIIFDLKVVRVFKNINRYFGEHNPTMTSIGTLASTIYDDNMRTGRLFYEEYDLSKYVDEKLGYDDETYEWYTIYDFNWKVLSPGFIGFRNDRAVFVRINVEISKQEEMIHNPVTNRDEVAEIMKVNTKLSKVLHIDFILKKYWFGNSKCLRVTRYSKSNTSTHK